MDQNHWGQCALFMLRLSCFITLQAEETTANFSVWHWISRVVPRTNFNIIQSWEDFWLTFIKVFFDFIMDRALVVMISDSDGSLLMLRRISPFSRRNPCGGRGGTMLELFQCFMGVSENTGTPKSSILIGFSIFPIHFGVPLFLETPL